MTFSKYFIFIISLSCHLIWSQPFIEDKELWKHVVSIDRLTWLEQKDSQYINKPATDIVMLRRLYLDSIGRLPTFDEIEAYLNNKNIGKQQNLIQQLLDSPGYALYYNEFWMDLLRIPHNEAGSRFYSNHNAFHNYIRRSLHLNKPYDQLVRELINSKGTYLENPAIGFYMRDLLTDYRDTVNSSVRVFLGTRIGCAQCHNHRFDKWTQKEFLEISAFFHGTKASLFGNRGFNDIIETHLDDLILKKQLKPEQVATYGVNRSIKDISKGSARYETKDKLKYPTDYRYDNAKPDSEVVQRIIFDYGPKKLTGDDPRSQFANWLTSKENKVFAKVMANRLWQRLMGIGLMEPIDDYKDNIEIKNPKLYDLLGDIFIDVDYNLKAFISILMNTQAYALQVDPRQEIETHNYKVQGNRLRRMNSQQISNTLHTFQKGKVEKFNRLNPIYFEFDDNLREIGKSFLKEYLRLKNLHNQNHGNNYDAIDPNISDLILKYVNKVTELEEYHQIDKHGYLKNTSKNGLHASSKDQDLNQMQMTAMTNNKNKDMTSVAIKKTYSIHQSSTPIKTLFGESDRSQPNNAGSEEPNSLQILKLLSDPNIRKFVGPDSQLIKQVMQKKDFKSKVSCLFYCIYGRAPKSKDLILAKEFIQEPNHLQRWSEFTHAMLNSPEFFFIQ